MIALYHLDDVSENSSQGALPTGSKVMLISIGAAWLIMGIVLVMRKIKKKGIAIKHIMMYTSFKYLPLRRMKMKKF